MERVRILLTLLLLFYGGISYAGTEPPLTLISLTKAKEGNLLYFKVGFSSLPPYEFYQFPSRNLAVVKFTHAISGTCEISFLDTASLVEKRFLKELRFVPSESTLRIIMNLAQGVKTKVYTLHSTKEVVIELERERDRRLEYREILLSQGEAKVRISLLGLDLNDPDLLITPVLARDKIPGLEETSSMARRLRALGGINGGYFAPNGDPLGLLIIDGELISEPILDRSAIAFTKDGEIVFGNVDFKGKVLFKLNERIIDLDGINRKAAPQEIILYTPHYGPKTGRDDAGLELIVIEGKIIRIYSKDAPIPRNGYVISLPQGWQAEEFSPWDEPEIEYGLSPEFKEAIWAIGGGPCLVKEGRVCITSQKERIRPDIAASCTSRSAIGITFDNRLLLLAVDQGKGSPGMRLRELAELMVRLGVRDGINLDGGSSSTLIYQDRVVNSPSMGRERPVASALLVLERTTLDSDNSESIVVYEFKGE